LQTLDSLANIGIASKSSQVSTTYSSDSDSLFESSLEFERESCVSDPESDRDLDFEMATKQFVISFPVLRQIPHVTRWTLPPRAEREDQDEQEQGSEENESVQAEDEAPQGNRKNQQSLQRQNQQQQQPQQPQQQPPQEANGRRIVPVHQSRIKDRPPKVGEKDSSLKIKIELDVSIAAVYGWHITDGHQSSKLR